MWRTALPRMAHPEWALDFARLLMKLQNVTLRTSICDPTVNRAREDYARKFRMPADLPPNSTILMEDCNLREWQITSYTWVEDIRGDRYGNDLIVWLRYLGNKPGQEEMLANKWEVVERGTV